MTVEALRELMNHGSLLGAVAGMALSLCMVPLVTLVHEAGHALAAVALGRPVSHVVVGDDHPLLSVRSERFRFRLGAITGRGRVAGFVRYDAGDASARDVFLISLAGPVASLAGAAINGALTVWAWPNFPLAVGFAVVTAGGLIAGVDNLRVSGDGPDSYSDGVWVRAGWRAMRRPAGWSDPNEPTSVAPPG